MGKIATAPFSFLLIGLGHGFILDIKMFFSFLNRMVRNAILSIVYELDVDSEVVVRMKLT